MTSDEAEVIALRAVGWLSSHEELLPVFLGSTGASEADFRQSLDKPEFLGSVLDFILLDDGWITAFCTAHDLPMEAPYLARTALPGGAEVHWT